MAGPIVAWGFEYEYRCAEYEYEYEQIQRVWDLLGREEHRTRTRDSIFIHGFRPMVWRSVARGFEGEYRYAVYEDEYEKNKARICGASGVSNYQNLAYIWWLPNEYNWCLAGWRAMRLPVRLPYSPWRVVQTRNRRPI